MKPAEFRFITMYGVALVVGVEDGALRLKRESHFKRLFVGDHAQLRTAEGGTVGEMNRAKLHEMLDDWIDREMSA